VLLLERKIDIVGKKKFYCYGEKLILLERKSVIVGKKKCYL